MRFINKILFFIFLVFFHVNIFSQGCSTCRAQIINSTNDDLTVGNGLNIGILFLMVVPYIILFFLFRKKLFNVYKSFKTNT
jgi:hypothetical protein